MWFFLLLWWAVPHATCPAQTLTVSAGLALREVLQSLGSQFEEQTGIKVDFHFASSGVLLAQLKQGAPVDVYIPASLAHAEQVAKASLVVPGSLRVIAGNQMVLIANRDSDLWIRDFSSLRDPHCKRIAIGQPRTVPAGVYAMQIFSSLEMLEAVQNRLIYGATVRQVFDYVARGEVQAGVVFNSDVAALPDRVRVVEHAQPLWHEPIVFSAVILQRTSRLSESWQWVEFLQSQQAQDEFERMGFLRQGPGRQHAEHPTSETARAWTEPAVDSKPAEADLP